MRHYDHGDTRDQTLPQHVSAKLQESRGTEVPAPCVMHVNSKALGGPEDKCRRMSQRATGVPDCFPPWDKIAAGAFSHRNHSPASATRESGANGPHSLFSTAAGAYRVSAVTDHYGLGNYTEHG